MKAAKTYERSKWSEMCGNMPEAEIAELAEDMQKRGQLESATLDADGRIIDGWHRWLAYERIAVAWKFRVEKWRGPHEPDNYAAFIWARNVLRRHLTAAQRGQIAVKVNAARLEERGGDRRSPGSIRNDCGLKNNENLAKEADVSVRTIETARAVQRAGPEAEQAVIDGTATPKQVLHPEPEEAVPSEHVMARCPLSGKELPERIAEEWDAAIETFSEWKSILDRVRREVQQTCEDGERWAVYLNLQSFIAEMKNAAAGLRIALPHCLCPRCAGDAKRCKACRERGWVTKQVYEQEVPADARWKERKA